MSSLQAIFLYHLDGKVVACHSIRKGADIAAPDQADRDSKHSLPLSDQNSRGMGVNPNCEPLIDCAATGAVRSASEPVTPRQIANASIEAASAGEIPWAHGYSLG